MNSNNFRFSYTMMFSKILRFTLFVSFLIFRLDGFSQSNKIEKEEKKLFSMYSKLTEFMQGNYDSASLYADKFEKEFVNFIQNNPSTLKFPFKTLIDSGYCQIVTSEDGHFRMYTWDTWTGGTMHFFQTYYQWESQGKVYSRYPKAIEGDAGSFCSKIFTTLINNKTIYLAITNGIFSNRSAMQAISAYCIESNKLNDNIKVFKTKTKTLNSIEVPFDFFSVVDRPERPLELITYDNKKKMINIPLVDKDDQVTNKNLQYQLKGNYFEYIGIDSGKKK